MQVRIVHPPYRLSLAWLAEGDHRPIVAELQTLLHQYGLYEGRISGTYDPATAEAVARFQEMRGLRPTGQLDPLTYCHLFPAAVSESGQAPRPRAKDGLPRANILITKSARTLTLFDGNTPLRQYPVAIGKPATPTPEGNYAIASKIMNPGGVLGSRWMGLNYDTYGIHGTNAPWLIGQMVSLGCIRMHNVNAEELFQSIIVGTPVFIRN
jgi:peptidoglycan hydrolase-like protein with peptidoglycan-binding domain